MVKKLLLFVSLAGMIFAQEDDFNSLKMVPEKYSIRGDFFYMQRNKPNEQVLTYNSLDKMTTYSTDRIDFPNEFGFQGTFTKTLRALHDIRFQYMEVKFCKTVHKLDTLPIQFSRWILAAVRESSYRFESDFQNARIQFHHQFSPNLLIFAGLEYAYIPEELKMDHTFFTGSELMYQIKTQNSLVGPDLGFRFFVFPQQIATIEWLVQMGMYGNFSEQKSTASLSSDPLGGNLLGFAESSISESGSNFSVMGLSNLSLVVKPIYWVYFYLGYSVQIVTGLSLAEDQFVQRELFPFPAGSGNEGLVSKDRLLRSRGRLFYQGIFASIQIRW